MTERDAYYLQLACQKAMQGLGRTTPNPSVGCIIVKDNHIIASAVTAPGGRPHAETQALEQVGNKAAGSTVYVSLEPCCHTGKTPPCTDALIDAKVARVVIAAKDPDPRVSGGGIQKLEEAGIEVCYDGNLPATDVLYRGFFFCQQHGRPWVTLKLATTLDGKIATASGESKWITNQTARHYAHLLRARCDGILVGAGTVQEDNPKLTCRLPGMESWSPTRIILDTRKTAPLSGDIFNDTSAPLWVMTTNSSHQALYKKDSIANAFLLPSAEDDMICLPSVLSTLGQQGLNHILVEGGATVAGALLKQKLVDEIVWITAPSILGEGAKSSILSYTAENLASSITCAPKKQISLGENVAFHLEPLY